MIGSFQDKYMTYYVPIERKAALESKVSEIMEYGIKYKDAVHVACAIYSKCDICLPQILSFKNTIKQTRSRS